MIIHGHVLALGCIDPDSLELRAIRHLKLVELDAEVLVDVDVLHLCFVRKQHSKGSNQRIILRVERPCRIGVARMCPVFVRGTLAQIMIQEKVKNRKWYLTDENQDDKDGRTATTRCVERELTLVSQAHRYAELIEIL